MNYYPEIEQQIKSWLRGEHEYQFKKNKKTHDADPHSSIVYILGTELENKWHRFQYFANASRQEDEETLHLHAGQQILKLCAAGRGALVWRYITEGCSSVDESSQRTWSDLKKYQESVYTGVEELPRRDLLEGSLHKAIDPFTIESQNSKTIFTRLLGLVVVYFTEQEKQLGEIIIPKPGVESGKVERWY